MVYVSGIVMPTRFPWEIQQSISMDQFQITLLRVICQVVEGDGHGDQMVRLLQQLLV